MPAETGTQEERLKRLSMLARYQPAQWANHINVDGSRHAVPIEKILERAMDHLPVLSRSGWSGKAPIGRSRGPTARRSRSRVRRSR
ncbi:YaaC family protein [Streptomyces sp. NPDC054865]